MWSATIWKPLRASMKAKHLLRCIASASLHDPKLIVDTTDWLSHHSSLFLLPTLDPSHYNGEQLLCHDPIALGCSQPSPLQLEPLLVPHPQLPEASVISSYSGALVFTATIMATPFQWLLNCYHHSISDLADTFSRTCLSSLLTVVDRSISLLRKGRPALTALQA